MRMKWRSRPSSPPRPPSGRPPCRPCPISAQPGEARMPLMSGGDAVVRSIPGNGISTIFCRRGVKSAHFFTALFDGGDALKVAHTRHEQGAAYMALGAALATGKPQVYS